MPAVLPAIPGVEFKPSSEAPVSIDGQVAAAIARALANEDERVRHIKMSWSSRTEAWRSRGVADPNSVSYQLGPDGFDPKLPAMWCEKRFVVQNCRVFLNNGREIPLAQVPDTAIPAHSCALCEYRKKEIEYPNGTKGEVHVPCTYREYVGRMLRVMTDDAVQKDPMLCRHCLRHTAASPEDYAMHLLKVHPEYLLSQTGASSGAASSSAASSLVAVSTPHRETAVNAPPPSPALSSSAAPAGVGYTATSTAEPPPSVVICGCGKRCANEHGLKVHRRRSTNEACKAA